MSGQKRLTGQVAIITGSSRGIGREVALTLARAGCNIVVTAKSVKEKPNLPGTIFSVAKEVEALGVQALPIRVDVRKDDEIHACVDQVMAKFGRIDILINNAGALWWKTVKDTPMRRYDLINTVNSRGSFAFTAAVLPHMEAAGHGHMVVMSPPINLDMIPGKVAYCISKFGMTMLALGLAEEMKGKGVAANSLWPATMVESFATINFGMGERSMWRKASILADAVLEIVCSDPNQLSGNQLIDEDFLRTRGVTSFLKYRCDPEVEPPRIALFSNVEAGHVSEGTVSKL